MNETQTTPAPAVGGRQVGQLLAGRYRLAMFKGGDDIADVWHALDESTEKVVTLEILRDRDNEPARLRFLAEAQRMAAIERPSVMRVAAIHNEATDTFIVFEHLIPLPVVLTGLTAVARDTRPATKAAEDKAAEEKAVVPTAAAPQAPAPVAPSTLASVAGPTRIAAVPEPELAAASSQTIVELDMAKSWAPESAATISRLPEPPPYVSPTLPSAGPDTSGAAAWGTRLAEEGRALLRDVGMDTFAADAGAFIADARARVSQRFDTSLLTSLVARVSAIAARVMALTSSITTRAGQHAGSSEKRVPSAAPASARAARGGIAMPKVTLPTVGVPKIAMPKIGLPTMGVPKIGLPRIASPATVLVAATRPLARVLGNRLVLGAAALIVLAIVVVASPLDEAVTSAVASRAAPSPTVAPSAALLPAAFAVPPLSAYGAAFESQGAYPTTTPNGNVEWVVALRNTGSAGWYRGIEGAQAALALPDGTGVAVQSTPYVAPGQVGWFVVHLRARAEVGTYTVQLLPRIDGRGPLPELGIFTVVTVAKNP